MEIIVKQYLIKKLCIIAAFSIILLSYPLQVYASELDATNNMFMDVPDTSGYADFVRIACTN